MCPVVMFNIKSTDPAWNGKCPRQTPVLDLGYHLGSPDRTSYRGSSRASIGQPQTWCYFSQIWNSTPANFCSRVFHYSSISRMLYLWHAELNEKCHIMVLTSRWKIQSFPYISKSLGKYYGKIPPWKSPWHYPWHITFTSSKGNEIYTYFFGRIMLLQYILRVTLPLIISKCFPINYLLIIPLYHGREFPSNSLSFYDEGKLLP